MMRMKWNWTRLFSFIFFESCFKKYFNIPVIKLFFTFFLRSYFWKIINILLCNYSVLQIHLLRILLCILRVLTLRTLYKHWICTQFGAHNMYPIWYTKYVPNLVHKKCTQFGVYWLYVVLSWIVNPGVEKIDTP